MIEETAEVDKMSRQKDLLIMERKTFLDNLANISYNDQLSRQVGLAFNSISICKVKF